MLLDTTCLVAAVSGWHEGHRATAEEIRRRRRRGDSFVLAAHALLEAYSVLTRLPANKRLLGSDALRLLEANWGGTQTVALTAEEHWSLLATAAGSGITGGQLYDAVIAACARKAKVDVLLTWNEGHFARHAGPFEVRTPEARV